MIKVLWVTNVPIGNSGKLLLNQEVNGKWMDSCLNMFVDDKDIKLFSLTSFDNEEVLCASDGVMTYYIIPGGEPIVDFKLNNKKNIKNIKNIIQHINPDIIHVWGTESKLALEVLKHKGDIPCVVFIQGVIYSIGKHYIDGIPFRDIKKIKTIRNYLKSDSLLKKQSQYLKQGRIEKSILERSDYAIVSNEWCESMINYISPKTKIKKMLLPLNEFFLQSNWHNISNHTILCVSPYAPFKGIHILLKALSIIKRKFPDAKLIIPGDFQKRDGFYNKLKLDGYAKYIYDIIDHENLKNNILFIGGMSQKELCKLMQECEVFCMTSAIENHSSTLIEAMAVGMPCISSNVGGIDEFVTHRRNALLYRYEEFELLAKYISNTFNDEVLRKTISNNAKTTIYSMYSDADAHNDLKRIYKSVLDETKSNCYGTLNEIKKI